MKYNLIITKISKSVSKQLIARHLASDPSISHNDALLLLDNLPFVYLKKVSEEKIQNTKNKLERLGVFCIINESSEPRSEDTLAEKNISKKRTMIPDSQKKEKTLTFSKSTYLKKNTSYSNKTPKNSENKNRHKIKIFFYSITALGVILILFLSSNANRILKYQKLTIRGNNSKKLTLDNSRIELLKIKKAETYLDSARQMSNDISKAIKFYKIALSFNRYNLVAWQGLLKAYQEANMWPEVQATKKQIEDIFGKSIFTIEKIIEPYGELTEISSSEDGICRIEYLSKSLKKSKIEKETYLILQAVFTQKDCKKISLYASTGKGTGLLVNIPKIIFPLKKSDYLKKASITFVK